MAYEIRKSEKEYGYYVLDNITGKIIKKSLSLDDANKISWQNKDPATRYQIVANSWSTQHELTWYHQQGVIVIPNGYPTIEEARLEIVQDLQEFCLNNDYATHPNPDDDYSILDTFTGEEVDYSISLEEASHPMPEQLNE